MALEAAPHQPQRMLLLSKVIHELLLAGQWSLILKEKLEQLELLVASLSPADFAIWSDKMVIFWKRASALKQETNSPELLLSGDAWKVIITSTRIVVTNERGEVKTLQIDTNGEAVKNKELPLITPKPPVIENGHCSDLPTVRNISTTRNHTSFRIGPPQANNEQKQVPTVTPVKFDLYDPEETSQPPAPRSSKSLVKPASAAPLRANFREHQQPPPPQRPYPSRSRSVDPQSNRCRPPVSAPVSQVNTLADKPKEIYYQAQPPAPKDIPRPVMANSTANQVPPGKEGDDFKGNTEAPLPKEPIVATPNGDHLAEPKKPVRSSKSLVESGALRTVPVAKPSEEENIPYGKEPEDFNWSCETPKVEEVPVKVQPAAVSEPPKPIAEPEVQAEPIPYGQEDDSFNWSAEKPTPVVPSEDHQSNGSVNSQPSMSQLAHQFRFDYQKQLDDTAAISVELKADFEKLTTVRNDSDYEAIRRLLWTITKATSLLKPLTVTSEVAILEKELFGLALCRLAPSTQAQYLNHQEYTESLKHLATFLRERAPVRSGPGAFNGAAALFCGYCKESGHKIANCQALANTMCHSCYELGHSAKRCPNEPLINMQKR